MIKDPLEVEKATAVGAITETLEEIHPIIDPTDVIPEA